jgi:hypothetical protein
MKYERILVSEATSQLREFYSAISEIESLCITLIENSSIKVNESFIQSSNDLINAINEFNDHLHSFYSKNIPDKDLITGLPINKTIYLQSFVFPDCSNLIELIFKINKVLQRNNLAIEQLIKKTDFIDVNRLLNKERIEDVANGRFREFAFSIEEKTFIAAYRELIDKANNLQKIYNKNTGGNLTIMDLFSQDEDKFKMKNPTWHNYKQSVKTRVKA